VLRDRDRRKQLESVVAGPVSRETFDRIESFEALFRKWNSAINLVAPSTLPELWHRHILDSAQLARYARGAGSWADLGSGGGFPGAIVAILLRESCVVHLVESNQKKAAFLRTTLASLGICSAIVHARRIEEASGRIGAVDIVSARALTALPELLALSEPFMRRGARGLFHKGRDYRREVEESRDVWKFDLLEHPSLVDLASIILEVSGLGRMA